MGEALKLFINHFFFFFFFLDVQILAVQNIQVVKWFLKIGHTDKLKIIH